MRDLTLGEKLELLVTEQQMLFGESFKIMWLIFNRRNIWREITSHKFEEPNCLYHISALQDGRPSSYKWYFPGRGFHVQDRSKRCVFFNYHKHKLHKIPPFCVGGRLIWVSLPMFQSWSSHVIIISLKISLLVYYLPKNNNLG